MQAARQLQATFLLQQKADAALAGLAVDTHHGIIAAIYIGGIYRQVRHLPDSIRLLYGQAFLDGILVGAGKRREHQLTGIRMARMHRQAGALLNQLAHLVDIGKIQPGVHALRIQVHRQGHQVNIAGTLAIAKQAAFHPIGTGHHRQLRCRHGSAAIVMRVHA